MSKEGNRAKVQAVLPPGWTVCTRSPGGVGTKYGFVHNAPPGQDFFGPKSMDYIALGLKDALTYARGLRMRAATKGSSLLG
jgi:hypothetical protein